MIQGVYKKIDKKYKLYGSQKLVITNHFYKRFCNESRNKDNNIKNKKQLKKYMQELYDRRKIRRIYANYYLIDNDMVVILDIKEDVVTFITFYGRRSQNPLLYNMKKFFGLKKRYGKINFELFAS